MFDFYAVPGPELKCLPFSLQILVSCWSSSLC